jgi:hypothetical protein
LETTTTAPSTEELARTEWLKCALSSAYFINEYCYIYDATVGEWIPFKLWPEQIAVLDDLDHHPWVVALKARQLGMTWLILCYILWKMIFHPSFTALIFSRREIESIYLLSKDRLKGVYSRLPDWAQVRQVLTDSSHTWQLSNGSVAYAFPTSAGDSYTAGFVFVDEADLVPDLPALMNAVKPTIDGGGQIVLLSRVDKRTPSSLFKRTYLAAKAGLTRWKAVFLPWWTRPERDLAWYNDQKNDILHRTGSLDDLYQQYPGTDEEALLPPAADRRLPFAWLKQCFIEKEPLEVDFYLPGLRVYVKPYLLGEFYVSGDPAEGNPNSDDSVGHVLDASNGEECAVLVGKFEPSIFAGYLAQLSRYYNMAEILPERNNHGHAVIAVLANEPDVVCISGFDGRPGWVSSSKGKALMYTNAADMFRDKELTIHSQETLDQLASIDGATLRAPDECHDDFATSYCLGAIGVKTAGVILEYGESPTEGYRG